MDIVTYVLAKRYVNETLAGAGALAGKSAYELACDNGFTGTPAEWLETLKGEAPAIGSNGTWVIGGVDTGVLASPDVAGYATEEFVKELVESTIETPEDMVLEGGEI